MNDGEDDRFIRHHYRLSGDDVEIFQYSVGAGVDDGEWGVVVVDFLVDSLSWNRHRTIMFVDEIIIDIILTIDDVGERTI